MIQEPQSKPVIRVEPPGASSRLVAISEHPPPNAAATLRIDLKVTLPRPIAIYIHFSL